MASFLLRLGRKLQTGFQDVAFLSPLGKFYILKNGGLVEGLGTTCRVSVVVCKQGQTILAPKIIFFMSVKFHHKTVTKFR